MQFKSVLTFGLSSFLAIGLCSVSRADITYFESADWLDSQQTGANTVNTLGYQFTARIFTNSFNEVTSAYYVDSNSNSNALTPSGNYVVAYSDQFYNSLSDLQAVHPLGNYSYTVNDGGPHDGQTDSLTETDNGWASATPKLDAASFNALSTTNVNNTINVNWGNWSQVGGTSTVNQTYFYLIDLDTNTYAYAHQDLPGSFTGVTLAANTLVAGDHYEFLLNYGSLYETQSGGPFGPGFAVSADYNSTYGYFQAAAVPEPAPLMVLAAGGLCLLVRRKR